MIIGNLLNSQLQKLLLFQLKLSVTEKLSSIYSEILFFLAQYSFIFDALPAEPKPLTPDPARDGGNWYGYAGQNPLIYVDPTGLAYYTGPTGSSVQSSNTPVTPHEFSETRRPSGGPAGTPKAPETPKQTDTALYNDLWDYLWDYGPDLLDFKDGWEKGFKSLGLTLLDNILDISLRKEINGDYEGSLYFQKYINQVQEYKGLDTILDIISLIPYPELSKAATITGFFHNFEKRDGQIVADNITGFIKGAQQEIKRIDYILENSKNKELIDFVSEQKNKLKNEVNYNIVYYFNNCVVSSLSGTKIDVDMNQYIINSTPLPGINYLSPFYK